jgi:hypothetical protein
MVVLMLKMLLLLLLLKVLRAHRSHHHLLIRPCPRRKVRLTLLKAHLKYASSICPCTCSRSRS